MGSLSTEQAQINSLTATKSACELRLLMISSERTLKYAESAAKISTYTTQMNAETDAAEAELSDDPTSEEYRQVMAVVESIETEFQTIIENIRDAEERAEELLDTQQEVTETKLEVVDAEIDEWKEARDNTVETSCSYFNN